jgi:hypothetical protein
LAARAAPLVDHFNRRYEFYGRKLRAIVVSRNGSATTPGGSSNDPNAQRFVAEKADEEAKAFAIVGPALASTTRPLFTEASRRGLIGVSGGADDLTSDDFERAAPLLWAYQPPIDVLERETAAFVCASLAEHLALHAGPAEAVRTRKFAVAVPKRTSGNPPTAALVDGLERCGVKPRVDQFATSFLSGQPPPEVAALVADWRADGITSVISLASQSEELGIMSAASRSGYQPEWVHIGLEQQEGVSAYQSLTPQDQSAHVFGVASRNKLVAHSDRPFFWAIRESQPEFTATINDIQVTEPLYRRLLLLAAGIQMAGPNLNPTTFERGLFKARFANPGAGRSPYFQASVRLAGAHRYMVDDLALTWWEPSADAFNEGSAPRGSWCYVDRGARWRGNWPDRDAAFFDRAQPCR